VRLIEHVVGVRQRSVLVERVDVGHFGVEVSPLSAVPVPVAGRRFGDERRRLVVARIRVLVDPSAPVVEEVDFVLRIGSVVERLHDVRPPEHVVGVDAAERLAVASVVALARVRRCRAAGSESDTTRAEDGPRAERSSSSQ
jgi:hypothetical protein